ncbi:uncharacterized protein EDB93DRAFT_1245307 [Suillus bovinus]|uniref:uncharacterized protein n=1 Tax=Suillus bovinus TaxID=48563 RepID=UPI001B867AC6|nr:uncharacterized protein EDB93DRAFT_1245307 [Suillus bovinus]KAG2159510.1 hypothetical protein EDB93DRAFT_1245307 [Suillus bovinus]
MPFSDSLSKTEKYLHEKLSLDGPNYSQWATGFKMWAGGLGLWPHINSNKKEPSPPASLSDPDQNILHQEKHAENMKMFKQYTDDLQVGWDALTTKYLPQKAICFNQYLDHLFAIPKANDSVTISQALQALAVLKADLAALTDNSQSTTMTLAVTASPAATVPQNDYKIPDGIFMLVNSITSLDFNDVVNRLKTQELHHASTGSSTEHVVMLTGHRGGSMLQQKGDRVPPKGFDEAKGDGWIMGWRLKCGHCSKAGHVWVQCHTWHSKDDKPLKSASLPLPQPSTDADTHLAGTADGTTHPPAHLTLGDLSLHCLA